MRRLLILCALLILTAFHVTRAADPPQTNMELIATARLTRMRGVQLWWNAKNRVVGASFKGRSASDRSIQLASQLPLLRTLVLMALDENAITNQGVALISQLPQLELLNISGTRIDASGIASLQSLTTLRTLVLAGNCDDQAMLVIAKLTNLEILDLTQTDVTDQTISHLTGLTKLRVLILNGTRITNAGVAQIAQLTQLQELYLGNTRIDDAAVEHLKKMKDLDVLVLLDTGITTEGIRQLQPAFDGGCEIIHQSDTVRGTRGEKLDLAGWTAAR